MNHLLDIEELKNRYFVLRHGQSLANVERIIISHPENGVPGYGLSEIGKEQVRSSAAAFSDLDGDVLIFTSDFKRAHETAEIAGEIFGSKHLELTELLRERNFGELEKTTDINYPKVWEFDAKDAGHDEWNVESAESVQERTTRLIKNLEDQFVSKKILLVAHGDALQILQTGFLKVSPTKHRELKHLETAEIREMMLGDET